MKKIVFRSKHLKTLHVYSWLPFWSTFLYTVITFTILHSCGLKYFYSPCPSFIIYWSYICKVFFLLFSVDIVPYCQANKQEIVPKLDSCSQYYMCSKVVGNQAIVEECSYPDLFSRTSLKCENFETVNCDIRPEPQAPCKLCVKVFKMKDCIQFNQFTKIT